MLTNAIMLKTNLLILYPTCPETGKHTKLPAEISIPQIFTVRTNEYINEQIILLKEGVISVAIKHSKQYKIN